MVDDVEKPLSFLGHGVILLRVAPARQTLLAQNRQDPEPECNHALLESAKSSFITSFFRGHPIYRVWRRVNHLAVNALAIG